MKTRTAKKTLVSKRNKDEGILTTVAESIGSTIGTIVGSVSAAQKTMAQSDGKSGVKRRGKRVVRKSNVARHRTKT